MKILLEIPEEMNGELVVVIGEKKAFTLNTFDINNCKIKTFHKEKEEEHAPVPTIPIRIKRKHKYPKSRKSRRQRKKMSYYFRQKISQRMKNYWTSKRQEHNTKPQDFKVYDPIPVTA